MLAAVCFNFDLLYVMKKTTYDIYSRYLLLSFPETAEWHKLICKKTTTTISSTIKEVLEMTVIQHILQAVFNFFLTLIYMTYISFSAALPINSIFTDFVGDICFHYTELGILRLAAASAA